MNTRLEIVLLPLISSSTPNVEAYLNIKRDFQPGHKID